MWICLLLPGLAVVVVVVVVAAVVTMVATGPDDLPLPTTEDIAVDIHGHDHGAIPHVCKSCWK